MKVVTTPRAAAYVAANGGSVWVWLDPHRGIVGSHVWLEAHCERPRSSRRSSFTRSSRRPHRFRTVADGGITVHYDFGNLDPPDELHLDLQGLAQGDPSARGLLERVRVRRPGHPAAGHRLIRSPFGS